MKCYFEGLHGENNGSFPSTRRLGENSIFLGCTVSMFVRGNEDITSVSADGLVGKGRRLYDNWGDALTCASGLEDGTIFGYIYQPGKFCPIKVKVCRDCCHGIIKATEKEENSLTCLQWTIIAAIIIAILLLAVILGYVFGINK